MAIEYQFRKQRICSDATTGSIKKVTAGSLRRKLIRRLFCGIFIVASGTLSTCRLAPPFATHPPEEPWTHCFDFDGDGVPDPIEVTFSGGAHCCYTLSITMSTTSKVMKIPFELDGGYTGGLNLSLPDQFRIQVDEKGRAILIMQIATFAGKPHPIPREWTRTWGVRSHQIAVSLQGGLNVRNLTEKNGD